MPKCQKTNKTKTKTKTAEDKHLIALIFAVKISILLLSKLCSSLSLLLVNNKGVQDYKGIKVMHTDFSSYSLGHIQVSFVP